jgi:protein-disulfide isomerase
MTTLVNAMRWIMSRKPLLSLCLFAVIALLGPDAARAQNETSWYPLKAEDGSPVVNYRVPVELESEIEKLSGIVIVGNPRGDVTLTEFYDLNCPYCKKAAHDIAALVKSDPELRLILVPFPVLGVPSIQAGRVELALAKLATPQQFFAFNHRAFAKRGVIDGTRALAIAKGLGFPSDKLVKAADEEAVTNVMIANVQLGNSLGLAATPAFIIKGAAILGYPGKKTIAGIIKSIRTCDKIVC